MHPDDLRQLLDALDGANGEMSELRIMHPYRMRQIFVSLREHAERNDHLFDDQRELVRAACDRIVSAIDRKS